MFPASFFSEALALDAALDPESDALSLQLRNLARGLDPHTAEPVTYRAGVVTSKYAPAVYEVGLDVARVAVRMRSGNPSLVAAFNEGVPIPEGAKPSSGTDGQLIVYQPATVTMWEMWRAALTDTGWEAHYGGRIRGTQLSPGHYRRISDEAFPRHRLEEQDWGLSAAGIPELPGLMLVDQLATGTIGHALSFATWVAKPDEWVWPAQRTDGRSRGSITCEIQQGSRFRLPADLDTEAIDHPGIRMIATAVRDYGMVLVNTTGAGLNFYCEDWHPHGINPYPYLFGDTRVSQTWMQDFPWDSLQLLARGPVATDRTKPTPRP